MAWPEALLEQWIGLVLQVANTPIDQQRDPRIHRRVQNALVDVIAGGPGLGRDGPQAPTDLALPRLKVRVLRGRTVIVVDPPALPMVDPGAAEPRWLLPRNRLRPLELQLLAVAMLLANDPHSRRLRRCDWEPCRRFFFAARDHRREHSFCCDAHRRAHDIANRDRQEAATYMKQWRAERRRRAAYRKTRKRGGGR